MMARNASAKRRRLISIGIIVLIMAAMHPLQDRIERTRKAHGLLTANPLEELPAGEFFGTVLLGGFRAIAVDLIWLKAKDAEKSQDWHRYLLLNRLIASLQPRFVEVWTFNMWKMAYNLSLTAPTDREGWEWVKRGVESGKEGFERNPGSWKLAWHIGYHYFHRCGSIKDRRTDKYQKWLFEETGQTNWQHALYWFSKSYEVAGLGANPNWLGMVSATHRKIAYEAEEKGDTEAMKQNRLEAIQWLRRIMERYPGNPSFTRYAKGEIRDLQRRVEVHELEQRAQERRNENKLDEEFELLHEAGTFWMEAFKGNPYVSEQARHLEMLAARFDEMIPQAAGDLKSRIEALRLDIRLRLIASPEYTEAYVEECEQLDTEYTDRLHQAMTANDKARIIAEIDNVLRLRRQLFSKDPLHEKCANSMREIAEICEKLSDRMAGENQALIELAARNAWHDLLNFGHKKGAEAGIDRLKGRIETIRRQIGKADDVQSERLRQEALELLFLFYGEDIQRDWAEDHLREVGEHYTRALIAAVEQRDSKASVAYHRRSLGIWQRIRQRHPNDPQAKDNLNRMDEAFRIIPQTDSSQAENHTVR